MTAKGGTKRGCVEGWRKPEGTRKQRQLRAYDDEWEIIQNFSYHLKHGKRDECEAFVKSLKTK